MSENVNGNKEDNKIHNHIPGLGCKNEHGIVDTLRPWDVGDLLGLKRDATELADNEEGKVPSSRDRNKNVAETSLGRHDGNTQILEQNRQLEEAVCQRVGLIGADAKLETV